MGRIDKRLLKLERVARQTDTIQGSWLDEILLEWLEEKPSEGMEEITAGYHRLFEGMLSPEGREEWGKLKTDCEN